MYFKKKKLLFILNLILSAFTKKGVSGAINKNNLYILVNKDFLTPLLNFLKLNSALNRDLLIDLFGVDQLYQKNRFLVTYSLINTFLNYRIFVKTSCTKFDIINSVSLIFKSANWLERETFDMIGVSFENHLDLRRILTDYGFKGYPLRKDFPLIGYFQLRYDEAKQKLIYEPVTLTQKFRNFELSSPWNKKLKPFDYNLLLL